MRTDRAQLSASYHVLVVGSDLSGLIYAALAARAGYRVGVIAQGMKPNVYRRHGYAFLRQPERFYGFGSSPVVQRVFSELSLSMEMRNRPRAVEPTLQLVTPKRRLDLLSRPDRWQRELHRELGDGSATMLAYEKWAEKWKQASDAFVMTDTPLPPRGLRARTTYESSLGGCLDLIEDDSGHGQNPLMTRPAGGLCRALISGALAHLISVQPQPLSPLTWARMWSHLRAGVFHLPGGSDGLKELLISKLREQCGDFRRTASVEEVILRRSKAVEVALSGRSEHLGCELLVCNMDPRDFTRLFPVGRHQQGLWSDQPVSRISGWRMVLNVGLDPRGLPAGMGPEVLIADEPTGAGSARPSLWVSRPQAVETPRGRELETSGLNVTTIIPAKGLVPSVQSVQAAADDAVARLRWLIPWLDDHLRGVDVPVLVKGKMASGREQLAVDAAQLTPIVDQPLAMTAGVASMPLETGYRNVLLGGDTLFGGLGFEGAFVGARQLLALTRRQLRLKSLRPNLA